MKAHYSLPFDASRLVAWPGPDRQVCEEPGCLIRQMPGSVHMHRWEIVPERAVWFTSMQRAFDRVEAVVTAVEWERSAGPVILELTDPGLHPWVVRRNIYAQPAEIEFRPTSVDEVQAYLASP